jgi:hypothetical protein
METDHRQNLLNELEGILRELFADGLDEASDVTKQMVLHGLDQKRVNISAEIIMSQVSPLHAAFGVVSQSGTDRVSLFEIDSTIHIPLVITPLRRRWKRCRELN